MRTPAQRDDGRMLEEEQHVVGEPACDAVFGELTLPCQGVFVRHGPRLNDLEHAHGVPVPIPSSPLPRIAQRVARMRNAMLSKSQTTIPRMPKEKIRMPTSASSR